MSNYERLLSTIQSTFPDDASIQEQVERLTMKDAFRAPELEGFSWVELAHFIKTLHVNQLALLLATQAQAIYFTDAEISEVERGLLKNRSMHRKVIGSLKTSEQDKKDSMAGLDHNKNALMKVTSDPEFMWRHLERIDGERETSKED